MSYSNKLHLFEAFGVELEYMIVDRDTLQVKPIADKLIFDAVGAYVSDVARGRWAWSNELVLHVIELKTNGPAADLGQQVGGLQEEVKQINAALEKYQAMLLPTGMHPLMEPGRDTQLWPHEYNEVYESYNRIFDCQGHGWANLQSTHLNLPFADEEEFGRLHAAIRLLLPILPALSASSPVVEGRLSGFTDSRLEVYRHNQAKIPVLTGSVIPEAAFTRSAYEEKIFKRIEEAIRPHDADGVLEVEFLNSRGAIARFSRGAIEIRVLDTQECPAADLAILQLVVAVLQMLVAETHVGYREQQSWHEEELAEIFLQVVQDGQQATIRNRAYLRDLGITERGGLKANALWQHLYAAADKKAAFSPAVKNVLEVILHEGNLSERILKALGEEINPARLLEVYRELANCLAKGHLFRP